jgi:hypothetical protein
MYNVILPLIIGLVSVIELVSLYIFCVEADCVGVLSVKVTEVVVLTVPSDVISESVVVGMELRSVSLVTI